MSMWRAFNDDRKGTPANTALEPTPGGRARGRRVPALGGIQPRAARLNARR